MFIEIFFQSNQNKVNIICFITLYWLEKNKHYTLKSGSNLRTRKLYTIYMPILSKFEFS
jgi:hypothetical protein